MLVVWARGRMMSVLVVVVAVVVVIVLVISFSTYNNQCQCCKGCDFCQQPYSRFEVRYVYVYSGKVLYLV
jgi:hypothetical protein